MLALWALVPLQKLGCTATFPGPVKASIMIGWGNKATSKQLLPKCKDWANVAIRDLVRRLRTRESFSGKCWPVPIKRRLWCKTEYCSCGCANAGNESGLKIGMMDGWIGRSRGIRCLRSCIYIRLGEMEGKVVVVYCSDYAVCIGWAWYFEHRNWIENTRIKLNILVSRIGIICASVRREAV